MSTTITVRDDEARPFLKKVQQYLLNPAALHQRIANNAELLTREYVRDFAGGKHATATRLGGRQTGFYERAVNQISSRSSSTSAVVAIDHPGFARAFKDVTITARNSEFLTLPLRGEAYGVRAREFEARGEKLFVLRSGGRTFLCRKGPPGSKRVTALYKLVKSVLQKQDSSLLPPKEDYEGIAEASAKEVYLEAAKL